MAEHETTADIIAEMRQGMNPNGTAECQYLESDICMLADRLEAALKRELSKNTSKNGADFGQLGDAAKLREALVQAELFVGNIVRHGHQTLVPGDKCTACDGAEELRDMICAALAEPVRNCDVGTAKNQTRRFSVFCGNYDQCMTDDSRCPLIEKQGSCEFEWAQMPYEEGGAK